MSSRTAATMKFSRVNVWYLYNTRVDAWVPFTGDSDKQANAYVENVDATEIWAVDNIERLNRDLYRVWCANGKVFECDQNYIGYIYMGDDISDDPDVEETDFIPYLETVMHVEP